MNSCDKKNNMIAITTPCFIALTRHATQQPLLINLSHVIEIEKDTTAQGDEVGAITLVDHHGFYVNETYDEIMQMLRRHERSEMANHG